LLDGWSVNSAGWSLPPSRVYPGAADGAGGGQKLAFVCNFCRGGRPTIRPFRGAGVNDDGGFDAPADGQQPGTTISIIHRPFYSLFPPSIRQILGAPPASRRLIGHGVKRRRRRLGHMGSGCGWHDGVALPPPDGHSAAIQSQLSKRRSPYRRLGNVQRDRRSMAMANSVQ
jgi:hypothetical protein